MTVCGIKHADGVCVMGECPYFKCCCPIVWDKYGKSEPQTNEGWLRQANKEEMEHTLTMLIMKDRFFADKEFAYVSIRFEVHRWLKERHNG